MLKKNQKYPLSLIASWAIYLRDNRDADKYPRYKITLPQAQ